MTSILGDLTPGISAKLNLVVDLLVLWVSVMLSAQLAGAAHLHLNETIWLASMLCVAWFVGAAVLRYYDPWALRDNLDDAALGTVLVFGIMTLLGCINLLAPDKIAMPKIGHFLLALWPPIVAGRLIAFKPLFAQEAPIDEVLIVGTGALGRHTGEDLFNKPGRRGVLGYLRLPGDSPSVLPASVLGDASELEKIVRAHAVSEVYIAGVVTKQGPAMQGVIKTCESFGIPFAVPAHTFRFDRAQPLCNKACADGYLHYLNVEAKPHQMALKRLFDVLLSATALWLLAPLLVLVALAIKLTSRGPVLFRQVRVGLHGKPFHMLKFRSMVVDAEKLRDKLVEQNEQTGPVFKIKNDPRITAVGRFIRKYSIDELPQLINILRGDMSVVGPRPPLPSEVALYEPWQRRRLSVRPGLTCFWQISGRNQISFNEWMYLDMRYVDNWSLREDLSLIIKTFPAVLTGRGAS